MSKLFPMVSWAQGTNIYEVNTRQYTAEGTFQAFEKHLERLHDMGVETLWMMPIKPISILGRLGALGSYYACSSYIKINPEYGDASDFKSLVDHAHSLGMKIIIDWVANHTGQDHEWTQTNPDFYLKDANGNFVEKNGWSDVIDLDYSNEAMQNTMIESMQYWIKNFDIDGFRCDMAHLVPLDFWIKARTSCDSIKHLYWLAECDDNQYLDVFDTNYAWRWMHATHDMTLHPEQGLHSVTPILREDLDLLPNACKLWFTSNHDENSWNGTEYDKYGIVAKTWAVFCHTFPGMPLIYSGQELPNYKKLAFFEKDEIDWKTKLPALHVFYQSLLKLRKNNPCFHTDVHLTKLSIPTCAQTMAFLLQKEAQQIIVLLNFSATETIQIPIQIDHQLNGQYRSLFSGLSYLFYPNEIFELEPGGYLVYVKE